MCEGGTRLGPAFVKSFEKNEKRLFRGAAMGFDDMQHMIHPIDRSEFVSFFIEEFAE